MAEKRKYLRMDSVFPVQLIKKDKSLIQGFTSNVSDNGLCIEFLAKDDGLPDFKVDDRISISVSIPLSRYTADSTVQVVWIEDKIFSGRKGFIMGVSYEDMNRKNRERIMGYAKRRKYLPYIITVSVGLLMLAAAVVFLRNHYLEEENTDIVGQLINISQEKVLLESKLEDLNMRINGLKVGLSTSGGEIVEEENTRLRKELVSLKADEKKTRDELNRINELKGRLSTADTENLFRWIKVHQNKKTGLVSSFEGDSSVKNHAFTYDQALAVHVFILFEDYSPAVRILEFFKDRAKRIDGGFVNTYNSESGTPIEYTVNSGPNAWIGTALLRYAVKTGDNRYDDLIYDIASWLTGMQDTEGGIRGGPSLPWFSTEHNIDVFAFFNMLYKYDGDRRYKDIADRVMKWIRENTYSLEGSMIKRGKGDSTIATDTFSWAIAAIGPERLLEEGMDPDAIIKFAEENCVVKVEFDSPSKGNVNITGFDFTRQKNLARGGVISTEWTAQMIVAFSVMEEFYKRAEDHDKAKFYANKAVFYGAEMEKLIISSPSRSGQGSSCLPYSSQPNADTGHGWRTPAGIDTGSVAGTAYTIFARRRFNPLKI